MLTAIDPRPQRALRLACGTALSLASSFGLALPVPFIAPMLAAIVLAASNQALSLKAGLGLLLVLLFTTGSGLLLIPLLRDAPATGVLLVGLGLFLSFRLGLRGGNKLLVTFLVIGLTMIPAAGHTAFAFGVLIIEALSKGLLVAVLMITVSHWLFPEPANTSPPPATRPPDDLESGWIALRAALVVMPAFLLALINPTSYLPLIMQAVNLGQQSCGVTARNAGRELLGSTLFGGLLAILFWTGLSIFVHLWPFFLWLLLFSLLLARKLYALSPTRLPPGFWLNSLTTLILLLGQSVQDSAAGKDVYSAFAVRMALFTAVTLYACAAVYLIDNHRLRRQSLRAPA